MLENSLPYYAGSLPEKTAVTMVVHGLNVRPEAMLPLIHLVNSFGSDVYLVRLSGHREEEHDVDNITAAVWQQEMWSAYAIARKAADTLSVPLYFLGYSLGALLGQSMIAAGGGSVRFSKQVLLAPATTIRQRCYLLKAFFFLGSKRRLPSFTPPGYRVNASLPLGFYQALFAEEQKPLHLAYANLQLPSLIIIDPEDELISYQKLLRHIRTFQLTQYEMVVLDTKMNGRTGNYHHLILDEPTMGKQNWELAVKKITAFLFRLQE